MMLSVRVDLLRGDVRQGFVQVPVELKSLFFERLLHNHSCFSQTSFVRPCVRQRD